METLVLSRKMMAIEKMRCLFGVCVSAMMKLQQVCGISFSAYQAEEKAAPKEKVQTAQKAEELMQLYGNAILRLAYSYLHNMSDAEDIVQETLIRYMVKMPKLAGAAHEKAWLLRVAGNLSKNRIVYNKLRETDELDEQLIGEKREDLSYVWQAVKSLPVAYREAIHLFYYEGYSTARIAEIMQKKEATVRSDLRRGRIMLKDILKEAYDFA